MPLPLPRYGKDLMARLDAQKPLLMKEAEQRERERRAVRQQRCAGASGADRLAAGGCRASSPRPLHLHPPVCSPWYGPDRPQWLGPLSRDPPAHLAGVLPGDYGWDPVGLGREPAQLDRYVELELLHARWAMLGALGAMVPGGRAAGGAFPPPHARHGTPGTRLFMRPPRLPLLAEVLQLSGAASFLEPRWWNVGYAKLTTDEELAYLGEQGGGLALVCVCMHGMADEQPSIQCSPRPPLWPALALQGSQACASRAARAWPSSLFAR